MPTEGQPARFDATPERSGTSFERRVVQLKRRLVREATMAIGMLESALAALWTLDADAGRSVRSQDDRVDEEEVKIEQECYDLLTLHHPFARDFRVVTFILKVNSDIERVADHATSIAKTVVRISKLRPGLPVPRWPTALAELGQRVPSFCHDLMRAVLDEDPSAAQRIVAGDEIIDQLDKRLFDEIMEFVRLEGGGEPAMATGMLVYRVGRELERVGDLMKNVAEDIVYLNTGSIVRHEHRRQAP
jgi:phosphate transport system protein